MSDVFYLSIYHGTSAHHQYSTCLITCAQSLYSIINFQLTLSAFITNSPVQIEMITSPSALKTLKQVRTWSATRPFSVSSRNAPPQWGGALRDDSKNGCSAD